MTHLYKIRTKDGRLINFYPNDIQGRIWDHAGKDISAGKPLREFYLKYRKGGVSTFWLLWYLDDTLFRPNTITGVLAHKWESLHHLWEIIDVAWKNLKPEFRQRLTAESKSKLAFGDMNSQLFISLSIRSITLHNLHISEWCFIKDQDIIATLGAASRFTNITGESTANGVGNDGYETYMQAKRGESEYRSAFYPWFIDRDNSMALMGMDAPTPTKEEQKVVDMAKKDFGVTMTPEQLLWRRYALRQFKKAFYAEFPEDDETAFLMSGDRFFDSKKVMTLFTEAKEFAANNKPFAETEDYVQWEEYDSRDTYVAGADVAEGVDGDYSVLVILNASKQRVAFRYRARVGVDVFYRVCGKWGRNYGDCLLAVERNNHGHAVILGLVETERYRNLFVEVRDTRIISKGSGGSARVDQGPLAHIQHVGWTTDASSKHVMCDALKLAFEDDSDIDHENFEPAWTVYDLELLGEALTFTAKDGKLTAESGKHDDCVIAYAIAHQMFLKMKGRIHRKEEPAGIYIGSPREAQ